METKFKSRRSRALTYSVVITMLFASVSTSLPRLAHAGDSFDCDAAIDNATQTSQRATYCAARDLAVMAKAKGRSARYAWAAAGAICSVACFSIVGAFGGCIAPTAAATIYEGVATDNLLNSISSTAMNLAGSLALDQLQNGKKAKDAASGDGSQTTTSGAKAGAVKVSACAGALFAATKVMALSKSQGSMQSIIDDTEGSLPPLDGNGPTLPGGGSIPVGPNYGSGSLPGGSAPNQGSGGIVGGGLYGGDTSGSSGKKGSGITDPCSGVSASGPVQASSVVECATAVDPSLNDFMGGQNLADAFQKVTGHTMQDFIDSGAGNQPTSQLASDLAKNSLGSDKAGLVRDSFRSIENIVNKNNIDSTYAGSAGGLGKASGDADPMGSALANMMKQLAGDGAKDGGASLGVNQLQFGNRGPASGTAADPYYDAESDARNRSLSLFKRVSRRYGAVAPALAE